MVQLLFIYQGGSLTTHVLQLWGVASGATCLNVTVHKELECIHSQFTVV